MTNIFVVAIGLVIAIGRFLIVPRLNLPTVEGSYEAFSHLFVGGLFGYWWGDKKNTDFIHPAFTIAILLSLLELFMFIWQKAAL